MHLELQQPDSNIYVKHYQPGKIQFPKFCANTSVIFNRNSIIDHAWHVISCDDISKENTIALMTTVYEVILLGTGNTLIIPPQKILNMFTRLGKSLDFMNSSAACRTFNILAHDRRNVIAAIIV